MFLSGTVTAFLMWGWYFSAALTPGISLNPDGTTAVAEVFSWSSLYLAALPAVVCALVGLFAGIGFYRLFHRRRNPALVAVAVGPAMAFVVNVAGNVYTLVTEVRPGEVYLGARPVVIASFALIGLVPPLVASAAVVLLSRRDQAATAMMDSEPSASG